MIKIIFLLITALLGAIDSYKILGLFPHPGRSHHQVFEPLLLNLAKRGHELTIYSHFPLDEDPEGWNHINITDEKVFQKEIFNLEQFEYDYLDFRIRSHVWELYILADIGRKMCEKLTSLPEIKDLIRNRPKFDVILTEQFISDCSLGISYHLGAPVIGLQSTTMFSWNYERLEQPADSSYIPNLFLPLPFQMSFVQRFVNTFVNTVHNIYHRYIINTMDELILQKNLNLNLPPLHQIAKNISVILSNTHYTLNGVKPVMPGFVEVAGMHIKEQEKKIDSKLEIFLNEADHGVILFSMGSMIKTSTFSPIKLEYIFDTFSKLKQKIILKNEGNVPDGIPDNVLVLKWLPQFELLHHPKVIAFISHGGLLGTLEALHAAKPVLFMPVYGDQFLNSAAAEENGLGVSIPYTYLTKEKFETGIKKILSSELRESALKLSEAWKDNPHPLNIATKTVEHVARHGGLRRQSKARYLYWYQKMLLDVYLLYIIIIYGVYKFLNFILFKIFKNKEKKD